MYYDYIIVEIIEVGIVLIGIEIKSVCVVCIILKDGYV